MKLSGDIKIILPASDIDDGATVYKIKGSVPYTLRNKLIIYGDPEKKTIEPTKGVIFLINAHGNINAVPDTTELMVLVDADDFANHLYYEDK